jgi:hypothetical protein
MSKFVIPGGNDVADDAIAAFLSRLVFEFPEPLPMPASLFTVKDRLRVCVLVSVSVCCRGFV